VVDVTIRWKGGAVSRHRLRRAGAKAAAVAAQLAAEGFQTADGRPWIAGRVRKLWSRHGLRRPLPQREYPDGCGRAEWWIGDLARELGMSTHGLMNWVRRGWIRARQTGGVGRCWIVWADAAELARLRQLWAPRQRPFPEELTTPRPQQRSEREGAGGGRKAKAKAGSRSRRRSAG
jgi:hypothetical protein